MDNKITYRVTSNGLVDEDLYEYDLTIYGDEGIPMSWVTYRKDLNRRLIIIGMVGTKQEFRNQGLSKRVLDILFQGLQKTKWPVCVEAYTAAGEIYIRHVIENLAAKYGVRMIKC